MSSPSMNAKSDQGISGTSNVVSERSFSRRTGLSSCVFSSKTVDLLELAYSTSAISPIGIVNASCVPQHPDFFITLHLPSSELLVSRPYLATSLCGASALTWSDLLVIGFASNAVIVWCEIADEPCRVSLSGSVNGIGDWGLSTSWPAVVILGKSVAISKCVLSLSTPRFGFGQSKVGILDEEAERLQEEACLWWDTATDTRPSSSLGASFSAAKSVPSCSCFVPAESLWLKRSGHVVSAGNLGSCSCLSWSTWLVASCCFLASQPAFCFWSFSQHLDFEAAIFRRKMRRAALEAGIELSLDCRAGTKLVRVLFPLKALAAAETSVCNRWAKTP